MRRAPQRGAVVPESDAGDQSEGEARRRRWVPWPCRIGGTVTTRYGIRFADGEWLERYESDGFIAEPVGTRDPQKARGFDSPEAADAHLKWTTWGPDEATVQPLPAKC